jgi:hypothetical protein
MRNDAVKNALGESYTEQFRLSTFLLIIRLTRPNHAGERPTARVTGGWAG